MNKRIEVISSLEVMAWEKLTESDANLVTQAKEILEKAHAPYSNFFVGAAVLLESGEVFVGNNQENVSFPVGICAERTVLSYVMANFPEKRPLKIAIAAKRKGDSTYAYVTPCGMCRQFINEYEVKFGKPIEILMLNSSGEVLKVGGIEQLLPFRFDSLHQK